MEVDTTGDYFGDYSSYSLAELGLNDDEGVSNELAMVVSSRSVFLLGFSGSNFIRPIPVVRGRQGKDQKYTKSSTN